MTPESPPILTEMMKYFIEANPRKWNILSYRLEISGPYELEPVMGARHGSVIQPIIMGYDSNGFARGWAIHLN